MKKERVVHINIKEFYTLIQKMESSLDIKITEYCPFFRNMEDCCNFILGSFIMYEETNFSVNAEVYSILENWMKKELDVKIYPCSKMDEIVPYKIRLNLINKLNEDFNTKYFKPIVGSIGVVIIFILLLVTTPFILIINWILGICSITLLILLLVYNEELIRKFSTATFKDFADKFARDNYYLFNPYKNKFNRNEIRANIIDSFSEITKRSITIDTKFEFKIESND